MTITWRIYDSERMYDSDCFGRNHGVTLVQLIGQTQDAGRKTHSEEAGLRFYHLYRQNSEGQGLQTGFQIYSDLDRGEQDLEGYSTRKEYH